jgi:hypothetical protein
VVTFTVRVGASPVIDGEMEIEYVAVACRKIVIVPKSDCVGSGERVVLGDGDADGEPEVEALPSKKAKKKAKPKAKPKAGMADSA